MLLWTFQFKFLCGHMCSFLLAVYLGVKLLHYMVTLCLTFRINAKRFSKQLHHFASHQQRLRAPVPPVVSFHNRHLSEHLIVVLVSISLMAHRDEHLFMCLLSLCLSSLKKKFFTHFKIGLFVFILFNCNHSLYVIHTGPFSDIWCGNIFSQLLGCLFILLIVSCEF